MDCSHGVRSYLILVVDVCHTLLRNIEIAVRLDFMGEHGVVGLLVRHGFTKMCRKRLRQFLLIARLEEFGLGNHLPALQVEVQGSFHGRAMCAALVEILFVSVRSDVLVRFCKIACLVALPVEFAGHRNVAVSFIQFQGFFTFIVICPDVIGGPFLGSLLDVETCIILPERNHRDGIADRFSGLI